jgi:hypothetical protein
MHRCCFFRASNQQLLIRLCAALAIVVEVCCRSSSSPALSCFFPPPSRRLLTLRLGSRRAERVLSSLGRCLSSLRCSSVPNEAFSTMKTTSKGDLLSPRKMQACSRVPQSIDCVLFAYRAAQTASDRPYVPYAAPEHLRTEGNLAFSTFSPSSRRLLLH